MDLSGIGDQLHPDDASHIIRNTFDDLLAEFLVLPWKFVRVGELLLFV